jgi:alkylation response protein AidB-like acyl-CoA dehydrogenase
MENRGLEPVARARDLAAAITDAADAAESSRRIPEPLLAQLHRARLFRMLLPCSVGGDEAAPGAYLAAIEEIARHDASIAWNVFVANSAALIAAYLEPDVARTIFGASSTILAWGPPNGSRASAVAGGYRVSGSWDFASGCRHANWMGVHCNVTEPDGSLRLNELGRPLMLTLLFPAVQASLADTWKSLGLRGTGSDSYGLADVFVPTPFVSTREDPTLRREPGPLYAFTMQGLYAVGVAGVALGIARAMLDAFIALACRKAPRGLARLADGAAVQADVARAEARLSAARAYLLETLGSIYVRADAVAPIAIADRARVRLACTNAIHGAIEVADVAYKGAGTDAIFPGGPFERRFRDIHTVSQQIQARGAHFEAVGQVLLGMAPDVFY